MYPAVIDVKPLKNYTLMLTFDNNEVKTFDMKPFLDQGVFKALIDESLFNSAHVSFDTIEWSNGADICPETLYDQSVKFDNCA